MWEKILTATQTGGTDMLEIFADTTDGRTIKCFTWCLDLESGIARAKADAAEFGIDAIRFWAREI